VTGELIANAAKEYGHKQVHYVAEKKDVPGYLMTITDRGTWSSRWEREISGNSASNSFHSGKDRTEMLSTGFKSGRRA